jgi:hypothetical protein
VTEAVLARADWAAGMWEPNIGKCRDPMTTIREETFGDRLNP